MLQRIFDNIPVLLVIWNPHLGRFTLNRYAEQVLGWTTDDANNGDFMAKVYPNATYRTEVSAYMLGLNTGWREWICTTKDGYHVPIDWANIFLTNDTMIGIGVDLRERKKAEAKLKETLDNLENLVKERTAELQTAYDSLKKSERNLAEAQEIAHIGSWERDFASNEYSCSDEMYRIFGLKPQKSKINYDTFLNYVHQDDRNLLYNAIEEALKGKPFDINFRIILANGEERIVHAKAEVVFDEKNNPVRIRGTTQDITEQRKAAEKIQNLANIVESSNDAIRTMSLDSIITSWNKASEEVYGYSAEEIIGKHGSILEPPI